MDIGIETIGIMVLIIIVAVAVIIFLIIGVTGQTGILSDTYTPIIGNLSDLVD